VTDVPIATFGDEFLPADQTNVHYYYDGSNNYIEH